MAVAEELDLLFTEHDESLIARAYSWVPAASAGLFLSSIHHHILHAEVVTDAVKVVTAVLPFAVILDVICILPVGKA